MESVTVIQNTQIAPDTHCIHLSKPKDFVYTAGQFVVLQIAIDGKPMRRSYSLASAPHQPHLEVVIKKQPHGRVSPRLCALRRGEEIGLLGPFGDFTLKDTSAVLIGAGTGIAPFISYLRDCAHRQQHVDITLLVSFRHKNDVLYEKELEQIAKHIPLTYKITLTRDTWEGLTGRINKHMIAQLPVHTAYVCGPTPMVETVKQLLLAQQQRTIHTEKYGPVTA